MKLLKKLLFFLQQIRQWLQQPTTLTGLGLAIGGGVGLYFHRIDSDVAYSVLGASIPLLIPDNVTARRISNGVILPLITILSKNRVNAITKKPPDT